MVKELMNDNENNLSNWIDSYFHALFPQLQNSLDWTVKSAICLYHKDKDSMEIVALGSGVKCLSHDKVVKYGESLCIHDSHAEVLCRRAFLRYIWNNLDNPAIFSVSDKGIRRVNSNIQFIFYISHVPCGDASLGRHEQEAVMENIPLNVKMKRMKVDSDTNNNNEKEDILPSEKGEYFSRGKEDWSLLGVCRTKPGRRDSPPTQSMSCSDKLAMWNAIGIQGAALSHFIHEPVFISKFVIKEGSDRKDSIERALNKRVNKKTLIELIPDHSNGNDDSDAINPSHSGYYWWKGTTTAATLTATATLESNNSKSKGILIGGLSQGITTRAIKSCSNFISISQKAFETLWNHRNNKDKNNNNSNDNNSSNSRSNLDYMEIKKMALDYQKNKKIIINNYLKGWIVSREEIKKFRKQLFII